MALQVYNTLTRRKEPFETIEPGMVRMYVCGPTVYDKAHVGHAMSAIVFDMVRRYLQYKGYDVIHVMNFTDVDDKIIKRAQETGDDPFAISQRYVDEFHRHIDELRVLPATIYPRVSDTIPEIVDMVQTLQESRYAYPTSGYSLTEFQRMSDTRPFTVLNTDLLEDLYELSEINTRFIQDVSYNDRTKSLEIVSYAFAPNDSNSSPSYKYRYNFKKSDSDTWNLSEKVRLN